MSPLTLEMLVEMFKQEMVSIPVLDPIIKKLLQIPILNVIVAFIFWKKVFAVLVVPGLLAIMLLLLFVIWFERKVTARVQWRYGPLEISKPIGGIIQPLADGIRYLFQEVIVHKEAHRPYFLQFPLLSFIPVLLPILVIPAGAIYAIHTPYAVQIIVGLITLIPIVIIALGWASNSRYAYLGVLRETFMYFGYEVAFIIAVIAMLITYGTGDAFKITEMQKTIAGAALNPLACLVFLVASAMATSRIPFDIPEADQEVVFGPFVEYTGIIFGVVMTLAYEKLYLLGLLFSILFLSGWNGPFIPPLGDLSGAIWLVIKTAIFMMFLVFLRSVYPRFRVDQALRLGWSQLLSISFIALGIAIVVKLGGWL